MAEAQLDAVTGAFGYTGKYITRRLLETDRQVRTLTGHPERSNPFGDKIQVARMDFSQRNDLVASLEGVDTLYNTYWVRFDYDRVTFRQAVENSRVLFESVREAGVRRVVHISITNPSHDSSLPYFSGKARVEKALVDSGVSYAIIRPTVIFGAEDILINNIAWFLRTFPVFFVPGDGNYRLQPVFVEDVARIAVDGGQRQDNMVIDAVGPEIMTFNELVRLLRDSVGSHARIGHMPPVVALGLTRAMGAFLGDIILTREEVDGLMANLLVSNAPPTGSTALSTWLAANGDRLGRKYSSELKRHYR